MHVLQLTLANTNFSDLYISDLHVPHATPRPLSSSNFGLLSVPRSICKTKGDCAFAVLAPTLWNSLPHSQACLFTDFLVCFLICCSSFDVSLPFGLSSRVWSYMLFLFVFVCYYVYLFVVWKDLWIFVSKRCYINTVLLTYLCFCWLVLGNRWGSLKNPNNVE